MRKHTLGLVALAVALVGPCLTQAAPILQVDVEHRTAPDLMLGFESITLNDGGYPNASKTFASGISVDIDAVGYTFSGHDRHRSTPSNALSQAPLYRDFIFAPNDYATMGIDTTVTGLKPNQAYTATVWSFDTSSTATRISDWSVQDARGHVLVKEDYTFDGSVAPVGDADNRFTFRTVADGSGRVVIEGRGDPASNHPSNPVPPAVFLNALQLDEVEPPPTVLSVDINDRAASGSGNTQPGFQEFLFHGSGVVRSTTGQVGSARVTVTGLDGDLDDRRRTVPTDGATYGEQELVRDFVFAANVAGVDERMDVLVEGMAPGRKYLATVWSWDTSSRNRVSDWYANGALVKDDYVTSNAVPTVNGAGTFNFYATPDANGQLLIQGRAVTTDAPALFLNGLRLAELDPPKSLAIDFNDRETAGPASTQPGFAEFAMDHSGSITTPTSRAFGSTLVTVSAPSVGGKLDDRARTSPTNGGSLTQQELYRDFIFGDLRQVGELLDVRIQGLTPGERYRAAVWSYDRSSTSVRTSDWTANGLLVRDDYQFNGSTAPQYDHSSRFGFYTTADANGEILIRGTAEPGTQPALFLNALTLDADPLPATHTPSRRSVAFDLNHSGNPAATQSGFAPISDGTSSTDPPPFSAAARGVTLTVSNAQDDRDRGLSGSPFAQTPGELGGHYNASLLRDFSFRSGTSSAIQLDINGLEPNTDYVLRVHSYDRTANNNSVSVWLDGSAASLSPKDPAFLTTHQVLSTQPDSSYFDVRMTSDASGRISLMGRGSGGAPNTAQLAIFNGLEVLRPPSALTALMKVDVNNTNSGGGPLDATEPGYVPLTLGAPAGGSTSGSVSHNGITVTVTTDRTDTPTRHRNNTGENLYADFVFANDQLTIDIDGLMPGVLHEITVFAQDTAANYGDISAWYIDSDTDPVKTALYNMANAGINLDAGQFSFFVTPESSSLRLTAMDAPGTSGLVFLSGLEIRVVPEPTTLGLLAFGGLAMAARRRRKRSSGTRRGRT